MSTYSSTTRCALVKAFSHQNVLDLPQRTTRKGNGLDPEQRCPESSIAIPGRMAALERLEGTTPAAAASVARTDKRWRRG